MLAAFVCTGFAAEPTEFSTAYLDGKEFFAVPYGSGEDPLGLVQFNFTTSTISYEDIVPAGESGLVSYTIESGVVSVEGGEVLITLLESAGDHLRVEFAEADGWSEIQHWHFTEANARAALSSVATLATARIEIDGDFNDWLNVPVIAADNDSSSLIDIQSVQFATDAEFLYFLIETDTDIAHVLSTSSATLWVPFNYDNEFGTSDGTFAWFGNGYKDGGQDRELSAVGGGFSINGSRLEARVPLYLARGSMQDLINIEVEIGDEQSDETYDQMARLLKFDSGNPSNDLGFFAGGKVAYYIQTDSSAPELETDEPYEAIAFLEATAADSVVGATITPPDGDAYGLEQDDPESTWWEGGQDFPDKSSLDSIFPNGTYTFDIATPNEGVKTVELELTGDAYPPAPRVSNHSAAQTVDADQTFTLTWDAFSGAGPEDFVVLGIEDILNDDDIWKSDFLPSNTTSVEIPAGVLQAGHIYEVYLIFANVTDQNTEAFTGGTGVAFYGSETAVYFQTQPEVDDGPANGVEAFGAVKLASYFQTDGSTPQLTTLEDPFNVQVFVDAQDQDGVAAASITTPNGYVYSLWRDDFWSSNWEEEASFADQSSMDAAVADGTFVFHVKTAESVKRVSLDLTGNTYPPVPRLSNYEASQEIEANQSFTLTWDAFSGASAEDLIVLGIEDLHTGDEVFQSDYLSAGETSIELPANTLESGRDYWVWLSFANVTDEDTTSFTGARGFAAYVSETEFEITTTVVKPENDDFADAYEIFGYDGFTFAHNFGATMESGEPSHGEAGGGEASVWWHWTAPESGFASFNTNSSDFDTVLAVYTGSLENWIRVAQNDDDGEAVVSSVEFAVQAGVNYRIAVAGNEGATGNIELNWSFQPLSFTTWADQLPLGQRGELDDPGGRGIPNLLRYAFAMDPMEPTRDGLPQLGLVHVDDVGPQDHLTITFTRRKNAFDIQYAIEATDQLGDWVFMFGDENVSDDGNGETETVTVTDPEPVSLHTRRFLRVRVIR